jgi:hypothetical protein
LRYDFVFELAVSFFTAVLFLKDSVDVVTRWPSIVFSVTVVVLYMNIFDQVYHLMHNKGAENKLKLVWMVTPPRVYSECLTWVLLRMRGYAATITASF